MIPASSVTAVSWGSRWIFYQLAEWWIWLLRLGCRSLTCSGHLIKPFPPGTGEDSWESLGLQGDQTSQFYRKSVLNIHWKDWRWSWSSSTLATWCEEPTHWKRPWCWERLKAGGEGDDRGWDGWMASPTWWTWVWASSGSWWRAGKPGVLQSMGSQRVRHDWATELNWTEFLIYFSGSRTWGSMAGKLPLIPDKDGKCIGLTIVKWELGKLTGSFATNVQCIIGNSFSPSIPKPSLNSDLIPPADAMNSPPWTALPLLLTSHCQASTAVSCLVSVLTLFLL